MSATRPVRQRNTGDCGVACAIWLAKNVGIRVGYGTALESISPGRSGSSLLAIKKSLLEFGVNTIGFRCQDVASAAEFGPAIVAWGEDHYVVLIEVSNDGSEVTIMDPAVGQRHVSILEATEKFQGILLRVDPEFPLVQGIEKDRFGRLSYLKGTTKFVLSLIRPYIWRMIGILLLGGIGGLIAAAPSLIVGVTIDEIIDGGSEAAIVGTLFWQISVIAIAYLLLSIAKGKLNNQLDRQLESILGKRLGNSAFQLSSESLRRIGVGQMMVKFQSMYVVRDAISGRVLPMLSDGIFLAVTVAVIASFSLIHAGAIMVIGGLIVILLTLTSGLATRLSQNVIDTSGAAHGILTESIINFQSLKTLGIEVERSKRWHKSYVESLMAILRRRNLDIYLESALGSVSMIYPMLWLALSLMVLLLGNSLSIGTIVSLISLCGFAMGPMQRIAMAIQGLLGVSAEFDNVRDLLSAEPEETNSNGITEVGKGGISVENLDLTIGRSGTIAEGLDIDIAEGKFAAIMGPSGIGKTTFMLSLLGMNSEMIERISVNGTSLSSYNLRSLRRQIGYLDQNPMLFTGSLRENVVMDRQGIGDNDVIDALTMAGLGSFLGSLPLGLSTIVSSDGAGLSGGQAQRLCLARALVTKPQIVLLDEPTANLDLDSESEIFETISQLDVTRVVITHEPNVARYADQVFRLTPNGFTEVSTEETTV